MGTSFSEIKIMITDLNENLEKSYVLKLGPIVREYVKKFAVSIGLGEHLKDVDYEYDDDGMHLTGKQSSLKQSKYNIQRIFHLNKITENDPLWPK